VKLLLLIEDNEDDIFITRYVIEKVRPDCEIKVIEDGEEAVNFLFGTEADFVDGDLILLDINLPKVNGLEILRLLKNEPRFKKMPVVILTSSMYGADRQKAVENGADMYVMKPLGLEEFEVVMEKIFEAFLPSEKPAAPAAGESPQTGTF
jgi:CheY-like chemotaxis protein